MTNIELMAVCNGGPTKKTCATFDRSQAKLTELPLKANGAILTGRSNPKTHRKIYKDCLVVLDLDSKGKQIDFVNTWDFLENNDDTYAVQTNNGGLHLYYWISDELISNAQFNEEKLSERAKLLGLKGVDVRGHNGLIFGAGTKFENGHEYVAINDTPIRTITSEEWNKILSNFVQSDTPKLEELIIIPEQSQPQEEITKTLDQVMEKTVETFEKLQESKIFTLKELFEGKTLKELPIRQGFLDIIEGTFKLHNGMQGDVKEFEYWKGLWREVIGCGHEISKTMLTLKLTQPEFDVETTKAQLACISIELLHKRPTTANYKKLFPQYFIEEVKTEFVDPNAVGSAYKEKLLGYKADWKLLEKPPVKSVKIAAIRKSFIEVLYQLGFEFISKGKSNKVDGWIRYYNGVYLQNQETVLSRLIEQYLEVIDVVPLSKDIAEIRDALQRSHSVSPIEFNKIRNYINFKNGLLNTKTWVLEPHDRKKRFFTQSKYNLNYEAESTLMTTVIKQLCSSKPNDELRQIMEKQIWEMLGYILTPSIEMQKGFIFYSSASVGKSIVNAVVEQLVGFENISSVSLQDISEKGAKAFAFMAHKLVNTYGDLPKRAITDTGNLKMAITEQTLPIEAKFEMLHMAQNITKQVIFCNDLPYLHDIESAWGKRWVLWRCDRVIYDYENYVIAKKKGEVKDEWVEGKGIWNEYAQCYDIKDPYLTQKIIENEDEMEGIIARSVLALKELFARGQFEHSANEDVCAEWYAATSIVSQFIRDCCIETDVKEEFVRKIHLYSIFVDWKETHGNTIPISIATFTKQMRTFNCDVQRIRMQKYGGKQIGVYANIKVNPENEMAEMNYILDLCHDLVRYDPHTYAVMNYEEIMEQHVVWHEERQQFVRKSGTYW